MICRYCNGTGTSNTCVNGTFKPCAACNGTGEEIEEIKEKITNFDRITASPEALSVMETIDSQQEVMITCCKCHGKGVYGVPKFDDETYMPSMTEWEDRPCEVCKGTGKISLQFYEDLQKGCRR